jgi:hypothetical protein
MGNEHARHGWHPYKVDELSLSLMLLAAWLKKLALLDIQLDDQCENSLMEVAHESLAFGFSHPLFGLSAR